MNRTASFLVLAGGGVALGVALALGVADTVRAVSLVGIFAGGFWAGAAVTAAIASYRGTARRA